ncbi:L30e-like protein [Atractiella rhizophila]|nr:L30e-like protein [Atractiella rhizophila]
MGEEKSSSKKSKKRPSSAMEVDSPSKSKEAVEDTLVTNDADEPAKKKRKKEKVKDADGEEKEVDVESLCPIARPLAQKKMCKKVLRTVKKAAKSHHLKRGVKEVVKSLRKSETGLVVLAADISPLDILSHLPVLCEDSQVPYIFVPSKELLGSASSTKRPTSVVMCCKKGGKKAEEKKEEVTEFLEAYAELEKEVKSLNQDTIMGLEVGK